MPPHHHQSIFNYSIGRPYPYRWFTPVATSGFVIATILFSLMNFASNGYDLHLQSSSDPNATIADSSWIRKWPTFLTSKVLPVCQTTDIATNTQIFTNQSALTYTLTDVWTADPGAPSSERKHLPSLTYYNNIIQDCTVQSIEMDFSRLDQGANQIGLGEWGANVRAYTTCSILNDKGLTSFNLSATYNYVPDTISFQFYENFTGSGFLTRNQTAKASLYWGESLMSMYWVSSTRQLETIGGKLPPEEPTMIRKGTVSFTRNDTNLNDITSLDFFSVDYRYLIDYGNGTYKVPSPDTYSGPEDDPISKLKAAHSIDNLNRRDTWPNIWVQADSLAKSTYFTILTDLGQQSVSPNILTDPTLLQLFTADFKHITQDIAVHALPGPANDDYDTLKAKMGPLGVSPSVLSTSYICQVPQRKSSGNLFISILIADLVLLQTLWRIFAVVTAWFVVRKTPDANLCEGCASESRAGPTETFGRAPGPGDKTAANGTGGDHSYQGLSSREQIELGDVTQTQRKPFRRKTSSYHELLSSS